MFRRIRNVWKPANYQGKRKMKSYFEGWYFKIVDKEEENIYAIIPGVSFEKDGKATAFIQFFDGKKAIMNFFEYDYSEFQFSENSFDLSIGKNEFNSKFLKLDINKDNYKIKGKVSHSNLKNWPIKALSPGAMSWYRFVPFMECYHGVLGFDHSLEGKLEINGKEIDFTGGRGYIEKDYGRSFPRYYLWLQCNHFDIPDTSIMASFAKIPWMGSAFDGYIVGLYHEGEVYRFTTYTGAKVKKLKIREEDITMHFADKKKRLEIVAHKAKGVDLPSPVEGSMTGRILESITAEVEVKLIKLGRKERVIFEGKGRNAGLDIGGKVEEIKEV